MSQCFSSAPVQKQLSEAGEPELLSSSWDTSFVWLVTSGRFVTFVSAERHLTTGCAEPPGVSKALTVSSGV